jgi:putative restriction endonuclease
VFTLSDSLNVMVSESANGTKGFQEWVIAFHGKSIGPPQQPNYYPERAVVARHVREVFQGPVRYRESGEQDLRRERVI